MERTLEKLNNLLAYVKMRHAEAKTETDAMYWSWRIRDLEQEIKDRFPEAEMKAEPNENHTLPAESENCFASLGGDENAIYAANQRFESGIAVRLIDAEDYIRTLMMYIDQPVTAKFCADLAELQPTLYNPVAVMKEIGELEIYREPVSGKILSQNATELINRKKVLEIIRSGGIH